MTTTHDPSLNWDQPFGWQNVLPPSRPSAAQLTYFLHYIRNVSRDQPVLILGSTPEYRDLVGSLGFKSVSVFDKSQTFHDYVSKARFWRNNERVTIGDWRDLLPQHEGQFAIILSDLTSGNIPYSDRVEFYRSVSKALTHNGIFLDKVLIHQSPLRLLPVLYDKYRYLPVSRATLNQFNSEVLFTSDILASGVLNTSEAYATLSKLGAAGFWPIYVTENRAITPDNCTWYYGKSYETLESLYGTTLEVVDRIEEPSHSAYGGYGFWAAVRRAQ